MVVGNDENETTALLAKPKSTTTIDSDIESARQSSENGEKRNETSIDIGKSDNDGISLPNAATAAAAAAVLSLSKKNDGKIKKKELKLDYNSSFSLEQEIQMNVNSNDLAWRFLSARQFWFYTVPQALLTMVSAILAFMATSELFDEKTKIILNTIVGSSSGIVVFLQTMSGICDYGIRASMHANAALSLRNLGDDLSLLGIEDRVREYNKMINKKKSIDNNNDDDDDDNSTSYTFEDLRTRFLQSQFGCQSAVPLKIQDAFDSLDSSLMILLTAKNTKMLCKNYKTTQSEDEDAVLMIQDTIHFRAFDILATNIIDSRFWPFIIPPTEYLVEKTLDRLKLDVMGADTFWDDNSNKDSNAHTM